MDQHSSQVEAKSFFLQTVALSGRTRVLGESEHKEGFDIERHVDAVVIGTSVCAADEV